MGSRILLFDPQAVTSVEMTVNSPGSAAHWSARAEELSPGVWQLTGGELQAHSDRRANTALLQHWLDALSNLTLQDISDEDRDLRKLELEAPRVVTLINTPHGNFEISIGTRAPTSDGTLIHFAQWSSPNQKKQVGKVQGAALQMLEHLTTFTRMRATTWSPWGRDTLVLQGKPSDHLEAALQTWTHLQVLDFLDRPESVPKLAPRPTHQLKLRFRNPETGEVQTETYSVWVAGKRVFGRTTSRPAIVELYPKTVPTLTVLSTLTR